VLGISAAFSPDAAAGRQRSKTRGGEDGDELLPGQCGARAALAWRAEFAPSRSEGRRE